MTGLREVRSGQGRSGQLKSRSGEIRSGHEVCYFVYFMLSIVPAVPCRR